MVSFALRTANKLPLRQVRFFLIDRLVANARPHVAGKLGRNLVAHARMLAKHVMRRGAVAVPRRNHAKTTRYLVFDK